MIPLPRLYAVADRMFGEPVILAQQLFAGGARFVQVRDKDATAAELLREVEAVLTLAPTDARVLVNDRPDVALLAGAAGVHLGQQDLRPRDARKALRTKQILGYSTHNLEQALEADESPADYIAVGPVYPTTTKTNPDPVVGLEALRAICSRVRKPVVAIGGITMQRAPEVFACGVASVAVIGDLLSGPDPVLQTQTWLRTLESLAGGC